MAIVMITFFIEDYFVQSEDTHHLGDIYILFTYITNDTHAKIFICYLRTDLPKVHDLSRFLLTVFIIDHL